MLTIASAAIDGVKIITQKSIPDSRGMLCETYNRDRFFEHGIDLTFVQDTQSLSLKTGTVRGLHFQSSPAAQAKLVRVLHGSIFCVAVDLRRSSLTYGEWAAEELSAASGAQMLVPVGFAHGLCTLEPDTCIFYKSTACYSPTYDLGVAWDDPDLAIDWPVQPGKATLSERDRRLPGFNSLPTYFE